jgi:hypothetical protein
MIEQGMKESAETALRELPGVVGAFVQPDANGHPREIHLLIKAGPHPRDVAQQVKSLLETRLSIAIDQRIVSIAQLAEDRKPPARMSGSAVDAAAASEPVDAGLGRVRLTGVETAVRGNHVTVRVRLDHDGRDIVGEASELDAGDGRSRAAGNAAIEAVNRISGEQAKFGLDFAVEVTAVGHPYALASVTVTSPMLGRRPVSVAGAHPVEDTLETAAAMSVLKATNRLLGFALRQKSTRRARAPHER